MSPVSRRGLLRGALVKGALGAASTSWRQTHAAL